MHGDSEAEMETETGMETWDKLPLGVMDRLAELESYNRYHYRPIYSMHK